MPTKPHHPRLLALRRSRIRDLPSILCPCLFLFDDPETGHLLLLPSFSLDSPLRQFRSGLRFFCFVGSALNKTGFLSTKQTRACDSTLSAASVSDDAKSAFCDLVVIVTGITVRRIQSRRTKTVSKFKGLYGRRTEPEVTEARPAASGSFDSE